MAPISIPKKFAGIVMPFILSIMMSGIVSGVSTIRNLGFNETALGMWPGSWLFSWCVAFPAILVLMPIARRITSTIVEQ